LLFFWRGRVRVLRGFREKRGAERGFLMVRSWWNAGERWSENDLKSAPKNTPLFRFYFWAFPFWESAGDSGRSGSDDLHPTLRKVSEGWGTRSSVVGLNEYN
jgi:hypothetical protein